MPKRDITIDTGDGSARAGLFMPENKASGLPGVILFMDIFGPRPALDAMADRLAVQGYVVLVPDLFYRFGDYGPIDTKTAFSNEESKAKIMGMMSETTAEMYRRDTGSYLDALEREGGTKGRAGTVGYCMGGGPAIIAAAAYPERICAAASFHGGRLATDDPDSPHATVGTIKGRVYVGMAGVDRSCPPEQSSRLEEALRTAEIDHVIENYVGMEHGWTVPDHSTFDEAGAERHWKRLTTLFDETLR